MKDDLIKRLAAANPIPHDGPLHLPDSVPARPRGRVLSLAVAVVVLACAGVGIAAGFGAFEGAPAPTEIATGFRLLNRLAGSDVQNGFYRNMPQTDASKAHGVLEVTTPDGPEDLWSAPADNGTQCYSIDFANDYSRTTTVGGVLSVNGCEQSPPPSSNLDFSDVWFHTHPDLMTAYGSVYVPAATVQLTLDDGSTVSVPVVEHLFIASLPRGTKVIKAAAFDTAGNQVAAQTRAENMVLPS
jgi:hypothetical protein